MPNLKLKSALAPEIERFIEFEERSHGRENGTRRWYMRSFDAYCFNHGFTSCSKEAVEGWGLEIESRTTSEVRSWIGSIRDFARFIRIHGASDAYVLAGKYKQKRVRPKPYLFSTQELEAFFETAPNIDMRNVPWRWEAMPFFSLMHSCGLRTCEVRNLRLEDVDLASKTIDIVNTKGNHDRRIYINDEIAALLEECRWNNIKRFNEGAETFFVNKEGNAINGSYPGIIFNRIWVQAGLCYFETEKKPRPYDLRHHFAYGNIERWAKEGKDVNAMLPYLMRYMGHSDLDATLYYVHTSPDFLADYADMVRKSESVLPEVGFDD